MFYLFGKVDFFFLVGGGGVYDILLLVITVNLKDTKKNLIDPQDLHKTYVFDTPPPAPPPTIPPHSFDTESLVCT